MSGLGRALREGGALRDASAVAERAAATRQYVGLAGAASDAAIVSGFGLVADHLRHAADRVGPPAFPGRRVAILSVVTTSGWVACCSAVLLFVPNPARPWVLAVAVAGGGVLAMVLTEVVAAVWNRRGRRALAGADTGTDVHDAIADLRTRIAEITAVLEPHRSDEHEQIGKQIESALIWLDGVELDAGPRPSPETRTYRYRFGAS